MINQCCSLLKLLITLSLYLLLSAFSISQNTAEISSNFAFTNIIPESETKEFEQGNSLEDLLNKAILLKTKLRAEVKKEPEERNRDLILQLVEEIDEIYQKLLNMYPEKTIVYDEYGAYLYDYLGDETKAVELWEKGLSINPNDASINNNLALHYFHIGEYEKGWKFLQNAIQNGKNDANIMYNSAQIFIIHRNQIQEMTGWEMEKIYQQAMDYSKKATELAPTDFEIQKDYALNFFTATQFNLPIDGKTSAIAWQSARKVARNKDEEFYTWMNEARAWLAIKELKEAKRCLEQALEIRPNSEIAKNLLHQIESGAINQDIKKEKKQNYNIRKQTSSENKKYFSPLKNFTGKNLKKSYMPLNHSKQPLGK